MADESFPIQRNLKLPIGKRVKKLIKLRRRMRMWGSAGAVCAVIASAPLVYYLVSGRMPPISFDNAIFISGDWATVIGAVIVGLFGTMLFYGQFRRDKDKLDKLRAATVEILQSGDPVCECRWTPCSCKDSLIREMSDRYDINLSY